jgi:general nucleoside transport system permease protein
VSDLLTVASIASILAATIAIATPLLFGAIGELVTERAGIMNLSIEGNMTVGAFAGFLVARESGSLWLGVGAAMVAASLTGLLMAFLCTTLKVDQIIAALAINLLASGITLYLFRIVFTDVNVGDIPTIETFKPLEIPVLANLPEIGRVLFQQDALTYIAFLLVPLVSFFLVRTRPGLELRTIGENPRAADMRGVNVAAHQYAAVVFGAVMAGIGGAFLSLASAGIFVSDIAAGRGFIAFALVIFGNWMPTRILIGALLFGLLDAAQLRMQAAGIDVPYQLLLTLPYVLTIAALLVNRKRTRAPYALGIPYMRGSSL